MIEIWLWVLLLLVCCVAYWYLTVPSGLPPGTAGLPVFGYLPFCEKRIHRTFDKLGQKYGNLYHVYLGKRLIVILNDYATTKEAFINQGEIFSGRPLDLFFRKTQNDDLGLTVTEGDTWKQHRRFLVKFLKDYGVGTTTLGSKMMDEIHRFVDEVKKHNGKPFNISDLFNCSLGNNASLLVTGKSYDYDHPNITESFRLIDNFMLLLNSSLLKMFLPWINYVPGTEVLTKIKTAKVVNQGFRDYANRFVDGVRMDCKDGNRDHFIEAYLSEINARKGHNDQVFTDLGLLDFTRDLVAGGSASTAASITWAVLYLTNYPEIQKKIQKEIDEVIGPEREVSYQDRLNMPYTEATIYEINRITSISSMSFPRRNIRETTLFGYRIPSDTLIFSNLWNIHHDPKLWGDPENFRPDRFLDENRRLINTEYDLTFSIGKRSCPGEPFAKMEMFLYLVSLLQQCDFVPPNAVMPTLEAIPDFGLQPKTKIACAIARQN